eukprot:Colp12_sorted_trinity150504_noHs@14191
MGLRKESLHIQSDETSALRPDEDNHGYSSSGLDDESGSYTGEYANRASFDEKQPLLHNTAVENEESQHRKSSRTHTILEDFDMSDVPVLRVEWLALFQLTWPVVLTFVLEMSPGIVSVAFVGHLPGQLYLDASALATMFSNVTGLSIGFGLTTALDTLASQANGAKNYKLIGVYVQRGLLIIALACVPIWAVNWWAADILK